MSNSSVSNFVAALDSLRLKIGLSREKLGSECGLSKWAFSRAMNKKRNLGDPDCPIHLFKIVVKFVVGHNGKVAIGSYQELRDFLDKVPYRFCNQDGRDYILREIEPVLVEHSIVWSEMPVVLELRRSIAELNSLQKSLLRALQGLDRKLLGQTLSDIINTLELYEKNQRMLRRHLPEEEPPDIEA